MTGSYDSPLAEGLGWPSLHFEYEGDGSAQFQSPPAAVEGLVKVSGNTDLHATGLMNVARLHVERQEMPLGPWTAFFAFIGEKPVVEGNSRTLSINIDTLSNPCRMVVVKSQSGTFTSIGTIGYRYTIGIGNSAPLSFEFDFFNSQFDVDQHNDPKYWAMPLYNFVSDFVLDDPSLDQHPLRWVSDGSNQDSELGISRRGLISFTFDGEPGFIIPLPDYTERVNRLDKGTDRALITALMVGGINLDRLDAVGILHSVPTAFLPVLSAVTGVEIGAPWVELRDEHGLLTHRAHIPLGPTPIYRKAPSLIDESVFRSTGQLLTQLATSSVVDSSVLRVVCSHLLLSGFPGTSIDNQFAHVARALDGLMHEFGLYEEATLEVALGSDAASVAVDTITAAVRTLQELKKRLTSAGDSQAVETVEMISSRVAGAISIRPGYNRALTRLLDIFELKDASVLEGWAEHRIRPKGRRTWARDVSAYRGMVIHNGYIDFTNPNNSIDDLHAMTVHLRDVLARIVFKMVGYTGVYQPPVLRMPSTGYELDWVSSETPKSRLGYL